MREGVLAANARFLRVVLEAVEFCHFHVFEDDWVDGFAGIRARFVVRCADEFLFEGEEFVLPGLERVLGVLGDGVEGFGGARFGVGEGNEEVGGGG